MNNYICEDLNSTCDCVNGFIRTFSDNGEQVIDFNFHPKAQIYL